MLSRVAREKGFISFSLSKTRHFDSYSYVAHVPVFLGFCNFQDPFAKKLLNANLKTTFFSEWYLVYTLDIDASDNHQSDDNYKMIMMVILKITVKMTETLILMIMMLILI